MNRNLSPRPSLLTAGGWLQARPCLCGEGRAVTGQGCPVPTLSHEPPEAPPRGSLPAEALGLISVSQVASSGSRSRLSHTESFLRACRRILQMPCADGPSTGTESTSTCKKSFSSASWASFPLPPKFTSASTAYAPLSSPRRENHGSL